MPRPSKHDPWLPAEYTDRDVGAVQALARGEADEVAQKHALRYIVESLSGCYDMSFRPESDRATSFAEGRRYVGLQIVKMTKLDVSALKKIAT